MGDRRVDGNDKVKLLYQGCGIGEVFNVFGQVDKVGMVNRYFFDGFRRFAFLQAIPGDARQGEQVFP